MRLSKIDIVNFRSIANISISASPTCQGLVGINESGKTNILTAIALLAPEAKLSKNDIRMEGTDEEHEQDSYVEYYFELSKSEMKDIVDGLMNSIYCEKSLPSISLSQKNISIIDMFSAKNTGLYYCDVKNETKGPRYFTLDENEIAPIPWLKKKKAKINASSLTTRSEKKHFFICI